MNCFLLFFLKCVRVCESPLEMTVAVTFTKPGCTSGRPIREKSFVAATNTFSNFISSPMLGGQYPSTTNKSPSVTRHCFPKRCTIAKLRDGFSSINLLHVAMTSLVVSASDFLSTGATFVMNLDKMPPGTIKICKIVNIWLAVNVSDYERLSFWKHKPGPFLRTLVIFCNPALITDIFVYKLQDLY